MPHIPTDIKEMEDRIIAMKAKKQDEQSKRKEKDLSQAAKAFQIAIEMVSGVFIGAAIGYILDELFDFQFICLLIFTIFGGFAGMLNTMRYLNQNKEEEGK